MQSISIQLVNPTRTTFATSNRNKMNPESISLNLRRVRESLGLSITRMAQELGITRVAYNNLEKGKTRTVSPMIYRIADYSGLPPEEVLLGRHALDDGGQFLNDIREKYTGRMNAMVREYEDRLETMRGIIKEKENTIKAQDATIHVLQSMVAYLQKESGTAEK